MSVVAPQSLWMPGGVRTEIHVTSEQSGGALCVIVDHPPEGWTLPAHRHVREAETIHVVAGHFAMTIGDEERLLGPGETVHIPAGVVHSGRLLGGAGQRLVTFTPGGVERFFIELGRAQATTSGLAHALERAEAYGWQFV